MSKRSAGAHGGVQVNHGKQVPRLRRIEGQVRGLQQMIATERNCIDIAHQINAVIAALRRVQADMLREHLEASSVAVLSGSLSDAKRRKMAEEVGNIIKRMI